jgi:BirA family biotin operon repressor/biotin-[acetyl-CoA-carboxylase] ligase
MHTEDTADSPTLNALLDGLQRRPGEWIGRRELAAQAGVPKDVAAAGAAALAAEGYAIERSGRGFCYHGRGDRLIAREIQRGLGTRMIGRRIVALPSTASTNDDAWNAARAGAEEGATVFADEQTVGRGRMGRAWRSPKGSGVLMSVVLRPGLDAREGHVLTAMASVAVAQAMREAYRLRVRIRWPNDIYVDERKLAGILVEGRAFATDTVFVVGIGVNVNLAFEAMPPDIRPLATSLSIESGRTVSRTETARKLLRSLDRWYRDLCSGDVGRIANTWRRLSSTLGRRVLLIENGRESRGTVLDLSISDGLIVRLDEGLTRIFRPNTVTLRHLPEGT